MQRSFRNILLTFLLAAGLLAACGSAEEGIEAHSVWMRPGTRGEDRAVYFVLHNHSSESDRLTGVSSEAAERVELEEGILTGALAEMKTLDYVPVQAFAEIGFTSAELHVMLFDLRQDLRLQDQIEMVLHFENRSDLVVQVPVRNFPSRSSKAITRIRIGFCFDI